MKHHGAYMKQLSNRPTAHPSPRKAAQARKKLAQRGIGSGPSYAMIAAIEIESYWRTRSVGEAMDAGYSHLRA